MKYQHAILIILGVIVSGSGLAQHATLLAADQDRPFSQASVHEDTPAQRSISASQLQIRTDPNKVQAYNELALALLRRTRETADPKYLKDADGAVAQGLKLDPADFQHDAPAELRSGRLARGFAADWKPEQRFRHL